MNWNDLRVFLTIAERGSLMAAAKELGVNHSTVFRRLRELEEELGTRLFDRLPSGYVLTAAGQAMLPHCRRAGEAVQHIELELAGQDHAPSGKVRVTTAPNLARSILPAVASELRQSHPGILLEVSVGDSDYDLNRREADIALRATPNPPQHLVGRRVTQLSWWICGASRSRLRLTDIEQLAQQDLIGAEAAMMRVAAFQWLESRFAAAVVARANDLSTMASLAKAGVGLALLPSDLQEPGLRQILQIPGQSGELWLLTHPDLRQVQRVRAVWAAIAKEVEKQLPCQPGAC